MQRHSFRTELWYVLSGIGAYYPGGSGKEMFDGFIIRKNEWHQFVAHTDCLILEIQFGSDVNENDIERV